MTGLGSVPAPRWFIPAVTALWVAFGLFCVILFLPEVW